MRLSLRSSFVLASLGVLAAGASAQLSGLKTNLRTTVGTGLGGGGDTHDYQGPSAGPSISGHTQTAASDANASASASADATAAFGDLYVDLHAHTQKNPDGAAVATVTHDGAPSTESFDRIYVSGANVGATVTIHLTGQLTDLYRVEGSHQNIFNSPQGVDAFVYVSGFGSTPSIHLTSYRAGADVYEDHAGSADITATVGGYFDVRTHLYGDVDVSDTRYLYPASAADGVTQGRFVTSIRTSAQGVSLVGASGHVYQAVPEPASLAVLSLGALGLLRRRSRKP